MIRFFYCWCTLPDSTKGPKGLIYFQTLRMPIMASILDQIVTHKKDELASLKRKISLKDVQLKANDAKPPLPFLGRFEKGPTPNIIAEIKRSSPSQGIIRPDFNPLDLAFIYQDNGAKALSVLTDEHFFGGALKFLSEIKKRITLPCLRKDFTLNEYHVFEARGAGADAILLITAILDSYQMKDYFNLAEELGMSVLVEVHDEKELNRALDLSPRIIGVNNRDLKTFKVNLEVSKNLVKKIPPPTTRISESGLNKKEDLQALLQEGFDGFLIGETFMREKDVGKKLKEFLNVNLG